MRKEKSKSILVEKQKPLIPPDTLNKAIDAHNKRRSKFKKMASKSHLNFYKKPLEK